MDSIIIPLLKAYNYSLSNSPKSNDSKKYCKLFFNLVVVNSPLYTLNTETDGEKLVKVNYVPFLKNIHMPGIQGNYLVTFVHYEFLPKFISEIIIPFCERVGDIYMVDPVKWLSGSVVENPLKP